MTDVILCTPCLNYEHAEQMEYTPLLSISETCGRCGCSALEERQQMGVADDDGAIVECKHCGEQCWNDEIGEHHALEHPNQRFDPVWYYE